MRKMLGGLLAALLLAVPPVSAQNLPNRYDANGIGTVNYSLNSGGSFYGQVFNNGSASQWSLGFGSSQSTSGTAVLSWNSSGHVFLGGTGAPIVSSCGTNPSVALGSDQAGDVTLGSAAVTTCTLTFASAFTAVPHCFVNERTSKLAIIAQPTASTLVIVGTAASGLIGNTNDIIDYFCVGHAA